MIEYFDKDGHPLTQEEYFALCIYIEALRRAGVEYKRVGRTQVGETRISTVWLGLNHAFRDDDPPMIFETMWFGGERDQEVERYSTLREARHGHTAAVAEERERQAKAAKL